MSPSAARRRREQLLTGDYADLSVAARCDALAAARLSAAQQVSEERAQDARVGAPLWRHPARIADARVRELPEDDPRRLAYLRALREERAR